MKKLLLCLMMAASASAQVQITKNVQVGGVGSGGGTVTSVSGNTLNGFIVSVTSPVTSPSITVNVDGTHYLPTNTGAATSFWNAAGTATVPFTLTTSGSGPATFTGGVLNVPSVTGGISSVTATSPLTASTTSGAVTVASTGASGTYPLTGVINVVDGIVQSVGAAFVISSFSCSASGTIEAGNATTNPNTCTFGYTGGTPISGTLTDSASHTGTFTTPFASGTLAFQYCTVGQGISSFTFFGNASSSSQTAPQVTAGTNCTYRTFSGAGTAGATGATASGSTAVLAGATGTLASAGLGNQSPYPCTASTQKCYILMQGGSHTFTNGGFPFPMLTPTSVGFVNINGVTTPLFLYESTNTLIGTFALVVAS